MKKRTRLFCFLLALVMFMSAFPLQVFASSGETVSQEEEKKPATGTATIQVVVGKTTLYTYEVKVGDRIELAMGQRTVAVEVVQVADNVRKDDAGAMYKEV